MAAALPIKELIACVLFMTQPIRPVPTPLSQGAAERFLQQNSWIQSLPLPCPVSSDWLMQKRQEALIHSRSA